jgi:hypothetical protein
MMPSRFLPSAQYSFTSMQQTRKGLSDKHEGDSTAKFGWVGEGAAIWSEGKVKDEEAEL